MKTNLIALTLLAVLMAAPLAQVAYADTGEGADGGVNGDDYGVDEDFGQVDKQVYRSIKSAAEARRDELLYLMDKDLPADILDSLQRALHAMEEAEDSDSTDQESLEQYMCSLKEFRNTWSGYLDHKPGAAEDSFMEAAGDDPFYDEPPEELQAEIEGAKAKLITRFKENLEKRVDVMYMHVEDLAEGLTYEDELEAQKALQKVERELLKIQEKIDGSELNDAVECLSETTKSLDDDLDKIEDGDAADALKTVEKLEAKVQKTQEKKQEKTESGEDTAEEDEDLDKLNDELDEVKNTVKNRPERPQRPSKSDKRRGRWRVEPETVEDDTPKEVDTEETDSEPETNEGSSDEVETPEDEEDPEEDDTGGEDEPVEDPDESEPEDQDDDESADDEDEEDKDKEEKDKDN